MTWRLVMLCAAVAAAALFMAVALPPSTWGHEWFPDDCCHQRHCRYAPDSEVQEYQDHFFVEPTGETIPLTDPRVRWGKNPTDEWVRCSQEALPAASTICLFPPYRGG